jgi:hypothetical protein
MVKRSDEHARIVIVDWPKRKKSKQLQKHLWSLVVEMWATHLIVYYLSNQFSVHWATLFDALRVRISDNLRSSLERRSNCLKWMTSDSVWYYNIYVRIKFYLFLAWLIGLNVWCHSYLSFCEVYFSIILFKTIYYINLYTQRMARVNSADSYDFLKNLPSRNPRNFSALDKSVSF